jgi:hypothetical protein
VSLRYRGREAVAAFLSTMCCVRGVALGVALALFPVRPEEVHKQRTLGVCGAFSVCRRRDSNPRHAEYDRARGARARSSLIRISASPLRSGSMFAPAAAKWRDADLGAQPMDF